MKQNKGSMTFLAIVFLMLMAYSGLSQELSSPTFALKFDPKLKGAPIEITGMKIGGESFTNLERIPYTQRGIEGLSLSFKNTADKPIAFVKIAFLIMPTGDLNYGLVFVALSGTYPGEPQSLRDPSAIIERDNNALAVVNPQTAESFSRRLREAKIRNIGRLMVESIFVVFSDGTGWEDGKAVFQDSEDKFTWRLERPGILDFLAESRPYEIPFFFKAGQ